MRNAWKEHTEHTRERMDDLFRDLQLDVVDIDTREEYLPPLIGFFRHRARIQR